MDADSEFRFSPRPNRAHEILWRPWGEPAFEEARRLGRPVLLSLSAVWCHWCHVMDETSYSDPRVIEAINTHFVPIRVDNDRHPDVNRRYNMGGWPTTAFLTATGDIVTGATYLPAEQMLQSLERVTAFFAAERSALLDLGTTESVHADEPPTQPGEVARHGRPPAESPARASDQLSEIPARVALEVIRAIDPLHGGIGNGPKFPQPDVFGFLLAFVGLRPSASLSGRAEEMLEKTLTAMATGGMYDHVAGGFFRYTTQRDWSVPHYEKMLADNAGLACLYLAAEAASASPGPYVDASARPAVMPTGRVPASLYLDTATGVVDYLMSTLWRGDPASFGGSQDADEDYYAMSADERAESRRPFIDATIYVDWNALAARALLRAAPQLRRPKLEEDASKLLDFLWRGARRDGVMMHYLTADGEPRQQAPLLTDQTHVAAALLDAYEVTAERVWLESARTLAAWVLDHLSAPDGRLQDRHVTRGSSAGLLSRPLPALEENAQFAEVLLRLQAYTGEEAFGASAVALLSAWAPHYEGYGAGAAPYAQAVLRYLDRPAHIAVVGARDDHAARRLQDAALTAAPPLHTVQLLDNDEPDDAARIAAAGFDMTATPAAFVCRGHTCLRPITDAEALGRLLAGDGPG
jgi:uncharacterized protein